jgi:hypothetical protein
MHVAQRNAGRIAELAVAGQCQRTQRYTMKTVGERDDALTAGNVARQLDRRFDSIGAGRPGELELVLQVAGLQHAIFERLQEVLLRAGGHVETVHDTVFHQIVDGGLLQYRVVVPVVQCAGAGEKVDVFASSLVCQHGIAGF